MYLFASAPAFGGLAAAIAPETQHSDSDAMNNATWDLLITTETFFMVDTSITWVIKKKPKDRIVKVRLVNPCNPMSRKTDRRHRARSAPKVFCYRRRWVAEVKMSRCAKSRCYPREARFYEPTDQNGSPGAKAAALRDRRPGTQTQTDHPGGGTAGLSSQGGHSRVAPAAATAARTRVDFGAAARV